MLNDIFSLENSNIQNQYDSSTSNLYSDFKLNPPSYTKVPRSPQRTCDGIGGGRKKIK